MLAGCKRTHLRGRRHRPAVPRFGRSRLVFAGRSAREGALTGVIDGFDADRGSLRALAVQAGVSQPGLRNSDRPLAAWSAQGLAPPSRRPTTLARGLDRGGMAGALPRSHGLTYRSGCSRRCT